MKLFRFRVVGRGHFPIDMLRYDTCWPSTQDSACDMLGDPPRTRTITLTSIHRPSDRWGSFGWVLDTKSIREVG